MNIFFPKDGVKGESHGEPNGLCGQQSGTGAEQTRRELGNGKKADFSKDEEGIF